MSEASWTVYYGLLVLASDWDFAMLDGYARMCLFSSSSMIRSLTMGLIVSLLLNVIALWVTSVILQDNFQIVASPTWAGYVIVALGFALLNTLVRPLIKLVTLPLVVLTFGLMLLVINAIILYLLVWLFSGPLSGLGVDLVVGGGFLMYLIAGTILAIVNTIMIAVFNR